jgi:multiple sugar transport system substrate-binding protein
MPGKRFPEHFTRRRLLASTLGIAPILSACRSDTGRGPQPSPAALKPAELTFMFWVDPREFGHDVVVEQFQRKYPHITVHMMPTPQDYEAKWDALVAAGTPPEVSQINDDFVRSHAQKGLLRPLDGYVRQAGFVRTEFYDLFWSFPTFEGKWYAPALGFRPSLLFVNVDLFRRAGMPLPAQDTWEAPNWTWDDLLATARRLTADTNGDGEIDQWGVSLYHDTIFESLWPWNNGGPGWWTLDGTAFGLADPKSIEALEWVVDLTCIHRVQPPWDSFRQTSAAQLFQAGRLAIMLSATPSVPVFRRGATGFTWDVVPYPRRVARYSSGGLATYCIPAGTKYPDQGWALLQYMLDDEAQKVYSASGGMLPPKIAQGRLYVEQGAGQPPRHAALFIEAMKVARKSPPAQNADAARRVYRPALQEAYRCRKPVRQVIQEVTPEVNAFLRGT